MRGLSDIWSTIVSDIENLVSRNCYERVNRAVSFFRVGRLRGEAAGRLRGRRLILDAGAGPGESSLAIAETLGGDVSLILLDPSDAMLRLARDRLENAEAVHVEVVGVFESMPLPDSAVDGAVTMFAFRDAIDYEAAAREFCRVLKPNGRLVILDIYNPDNALFSALFKLYMTIAPFLAALIVGCGRSSFKYLDLIKTINRMPKLSQLVGMLKSYFREVNAARPLPGTVLITADSPRKDACR